MVRQVRFFAAAVAGLLFVSSIAVAQGGLPERLAAGDAAWERGDHPAAFVEYDAIVSADSAFSTRALFRVGNLHAWANRLTQAIAAHRLYVKLEPADLEGRVALGRTLAWASRYAESIAHYNTVLARESDYRDAVLGKATTLAWWGRLDDAFALYDSLAQAGGAIEAEKGSARVLAWRGDLGTAEDRWRTITDRYPEDVEGWVGLAQVLRWQGRPFAAHDALNRALDINPASGDAHDQMRWVLAEIRPSVGSQFVFTDDSEDNRVTFFELSSSAVTKRNIRYGGSVRWKSVSQASGNSLVVPGAMANVAWQPGRGGWTLRADAGFIRFPDDIATATAAWQGGLRANGRVTPRISMGAGVSRTPLDEIVPAVARRVSLSVLEGEVGITLHPQVGLGLAASTGYASGDIMKNDRHTGMAALRWTPRRGLRAALTHREVGWERAQPGVFFAPDRFAITEISGGWELPRDLGLVASAEIGVGAQSVRFIGGDPTNRMAPRTALRLGWRSNPGREIIAGFQYANVAAAGTVAASEYRYTAFTLSGRWGF